MSVLRIHFIVPDPEGPYRSEAAGAPVVINKETRFRLACGVMPDQRSDWDHMTGEPHGVRCKACMATSDYRERWRPKPGRVRGSDQTEETGPHGGCGCEDKA